MSHLKVKLKQNCEALCCLKCCFKVYLYTLYNNINIFKLILKRKQSRVRQFTRGETEPK